MQVCTSFQTDNHASTPPLSFYGPTNSIKALKAKVDLYIGRKNKTVVVVILQWTIAVTINPTATALDRLHTSAMP